MARRLFAGKNQAAYNRIAAARKLAGGAPASRRLFAGKNQAAYSRMVAAQRLRQGHPASRKLFAGKVGVAYNRELAARRVQAGGTPYSDKHRKSRATGKKRVMSKRQERYLHSL